MLNYKITGQGKVLVLIHGFCEDLTLWSNLHEELNDITVLSIDLPGFGASDLVEDMTITGMANELNLLLEKLEIQECTMIGHSLGGYVALDFAERFTGKLTALGLFHSTAFEDSEEKKENRNKTFDFIEKHGVVNFANSFVSTLFYPENRTYFENQIEKLSDIVKKTSKSAVLQTTVAMRDRESKITVLEQLDVPVLFIVGKEDQAVPMQKSLEQCFIPKDSVVHFYNKTAHMGMFEKEKQTTLAIQNFLNYVK
jgi:pimeloyl-ACP methyl ester carboxylesterase